MTTEPARRPLRTRQTRWAAALAGWLTRAGVRPNTISGASVLVAGLAGLFFLAGAAGGTGRRVFFTLAAGGFIQLRLLCNMLDGMVALEGGQRTKSGEVWNDLPDRLADALILVPAGYAVTAVSWGPALGWAAALLAVLTAYVRLLGGSLGLPQDFCGPMAKQHRMAVMTGAALLAGGELAIGAPGRAILLGLLLVSVGSAVTFLRRTGRILRALEAR
jgi:phosphatidylglycerophosphate synthase